MLVADVMTRQVATVQPGTLLGKAVSLMLERGISGIPVVDEQGRLVGIVTEGDLLRRAELGTEEQRSALRSFLAGPGRLAKEYMITHARHVRDVMTATPFTAREEDELADVVRIMETKHVKRLPVVDAELRVIGVVSRADLLRPLAAALTSKPDWSAEDRALGERVAAVLQEQPWSRAQPAFQIHVLDGVVTLEGTVQDVRIGDAARVAVENVPGVRSVINDIVWVSNTVALASGYPMA